LYGGALMDLSSIPGDGRARPSQGLLVAVGVIGVVVSIGAATGGFLTRFADIGFIEYSWGNTLRYAAVFALVGGMLALCQHEVGVPIVIGACVAVVAVVGTVLAGLHLKVSRLTDEYPVRGVLFVGVGVVGVLGFFFSCFGLVAVLLMTSETRGGRVQGIAPPHPNSQWVEDPTGRHQYRLWDGQRWSAHVSDNGRSGYDPLQ
jgi:hypothetical protein